MNSGLSKIRTRSIVLTALIVLVTLFWMVMLLYTNLPALALAGIGAVGLLLLAVATAWTVSAAPRQKSNNTPSPT